MIPRPFPLMTSRIKILFKTGFRNSLTSKDLKDLKGKINVGAIYLAHKFDWCFPEIRN